MFKTYINDLMRDRRSGIVDTVLKGALYLVSLFYILITFVWDLLYNIGALKTYAVPQKVISVGNITVGGTGKTPFVIYMAHLLRNKGRHVSVLTRGYGNDEWRMLEGNLTPIPVLVGRDRLKSARAAGEKYKSDTVILDDGYQQRRIKKDLNILLIDSLNPFGNKHSVPRGILREPLSSIKYADIVVLTKADAGKDAIADIRKILLNRFRKKRILEASYKPVCFFGVDDGIKYGLDHIKGKKITVFSGIADPGYFKEMLKALDGKILKEYEFCDHASYGEKDISSVVRASEENGSEVIVTTEKDSVKLKAIKARTGLKIIALKVELEITKGMEELVDAVSGLYSSSIG